jgi:hypothetical protein
MISPHLTMAVTQARIDDLRRTADARRAAHGRTQPAQPAVTDQSVTLRFGSRADEGLLARLAALDSSTPPAPPVLLAEVDGQLLAALALSDGTVVADPFHPAPDLIDLLRARARQLDGDGRIRRPGRWHSRPLLRAAGGG